MAIQPGKYNFICSQGSTFTEYLSLKYADGTAYPFDSAAMQVRETYASKDAIITADVINGKVKVNDPDPGDIQIIIPADETMDVVAKEYVYDVEIYDTTQDPIYVTRIIQGKFIVTPEVTR